MAASNLFDSYEQDFKQFITVIAQRLDADNNNEPLGRLVFPAWPNELMTL